VDASGQEETDVATFKEKSEHGYSVHWLHKQDSVSQANAHKLSNLSVLQEGEQSYMNN